MKCVRVKELVSDYVDGLVSPRVREEISEHLAACPACAREVETTTRMLSAVSELGRRRVPADLWPAVQARIEERQTVRQGAFTRLLAPVLRPLVALPVAAAAAAGVLLVHTMHQPTQNPQSASVKPTEMAAFVQEYSEFRSKQSFQDNSSLIAAQLERPAKRGD